MEVPGMEEFCTTLWIQNVREDRELGGEAGRQVGVFLIQAQEEAQCLL